MKKCPFCDEWNIDEVIQCRHCHEWLELEPTPRKKASAKSSGKKKADSIKGQTKLEKIWQAYRIPIISTIILVVVMFFIISQKPDVNEDADQVIKDEPPRIDAPAAPATEPAPARETTPVPEFNKSYISADDFFNNALALCSSGKCTDPQKAIEYLNEAIKRKPNWAEAYNNRGNAYGNLGQHQRAIEDYNEAIRLKPDYAYAYANRGNAYFIQNNKELGCNDLQKACDLGTCTGLEKARSKGSCY